ncbi:MAG: hypothetical protein DWQ05_17900 [Calditrichaeota bacterium]|nr:MAG: hypothetical protein DWQ05_17900 [Calditrichota bacterium]
MSRIGLLNEKPLHAALKEYYAQPGDQFEVPIDGFVIDIVREDLLLEIQTANFAAIKLKLNKLLRSHHVRLIYPIAQEKWIVKLAAEYENETTRRKSPKRGRLEDLFWEMVSFPKLLTHPNFSLEIVLIKEEEIRARDGKRNWRRKGWRIEERRLLEVIDRKLFADPADWQAFTPAPMQSFTTKDLSEALGIGTRLSQRMAYCLRKSGTSVLIGKRGRANLYRLTDL